MRHHRPPFAHDEGYDFHGFHQPGGGHGHGRGRGKGAGMFGGHGHGPHGMHGQPGHGLGAWVMKHVHGGMRAEPGDLQLLILDQLGQEPSHGYGLIDSIETRTGGIYRPSPGSMYPALQLLSDMGFIYAEKDGKRTIYHISEDGKAELSARTEEVDDTFDRLGADHSWLEGKDMEELHERLHRIKRLLARKVRRRDLTAELKDKLLDTLYKAADKIEALLQDK